MHKVLYIDLDQIVQVWQYTKAYTKTWGTSGRIWFIWFYISFKKNHTDGTIKCQVGQIKTLYVLRYCLKKSCFSSYSQRWKKMKKIILGFVYIVWNQFYQKKDLLPLTKTDFGNNFISR